MIKLRKFIIKKFKNKLKKQKTFKMNLNNIKLRVKES